MRYVSVDIETSALDPEEGQILEVALVVEDTEKAGLLVEQLPNMALEIAPEGGRLRGQMVALHMNAALIGRIAAGSGMPLANAEKELCSFLDVEFPEKSKGLYMAAKNGAGFDLVWLRRHMPDLAAKFHHRVIDPGSVFMDWKAGKVPGMKALLGGREPSHSAREDARDNIRVLRRAYT